MAHEDAGAQTAEASRFPLAIRSQRTLQVALGLLWILDAALQFQPFMFARGFVDTYILANASGQPAVLGDLITNVGNFLAPDIEVWNTLFALIQLAIGLGSAVPANGARRPRRSPSRGSLGVWVFGEGLGLLLTGTASALTGRAGLGAACTG